jgi:hypothetical protein
MLPASPSSSEFSDRLDVEHRLHRRYPIKLELRYTLVKGSRIEQSGQGATLNMSSGGVLFESQHDCLAAGLIELTIAWLTLPDKTLNLMMRGHIVRKLGNLVAVKVDKHEFDARR